MTNVLLVRFNTLSAAESLYWSSLARDLGGQRTTLSRLEMEPDDRSLLLGVINQHHKRGGAVDRLYSFPEFQDLTKMVWAFEEHYDPAHWSADEKMCAMSSVSRVGPKTNKRPVNAQP